MKEFNSTLKAIQYQNGYLFVDEQANLTGLTKGFDLLSKNIVHPSTLTKLSFEEYRSRGVVVVVAQSTKLSIPDIPYVELEEDVWQIGNRLKITTVCDYERRGDQYKGEDYYVNEGKQTYEGIVISYLKGIALKLDDGSKFTTQGTYWFGSVLNQKVELVNKAAQSKKYSEEDILRFIDNEDNHTEGELGNSCIDVNAFKHYLQSLQPKIESIELEMPSCGCKDFGLYRHNTPCINKGVCDIPVTYQKDGKTFLKVKHINYEQNRTV